MATGIPGLNSNMRISLALLLLLLPWPLWLQLLLLQVVLKAPADPLTRIGHRVIIHRAVLGRDRSDFLHNKAPSCPKEYYGQKSAV